MALDRVARERLETLARRYGEAYREVERILQEIDRDGVPRWVFALHHMSLAEIRERAPEVADAEHRRRAWRVALHAYSELVAFHVAGPEGFDPDSDEDRDLDALLLDMATWDDEEGPHPVLDRFLSTMEYARAGGCMYVDGTFAPMVRDGEDLEDLFEDEITEVRVEGGEDDGL